MSLAWRIELTPDGDGLLVTSRAFPELTTFGSDEADARVHARDALEESIAARIASGRDLPLPDGPASPTIKIFPGTGLALMMAYIPANRWHLRSAVMPTMAKPLKKHRIIARSQALCAN